MADKEKADHEEIHGQGQQVHDDARGRAPGMAEAARMSAGDATDGALFGLQQSAGNAAFSQMVAQRRAPEAPDHGALVQAAISSSGQSLDGGTRRDLEADTGADLSSMKVHTGPAASAAAEAVSAQAFTVGNSVVVNDSSFDAKSTAGRHLIRHEAEHVIQQRSGPVSATDTGTGVAVSDPADSFEQAAESRAQAFTDRHAGHDH